MRSIAVLLVATGAVPAAAQVTTGTVSGTVRDAQGGSIPGATLTLVNETQSTRSAPAVSNQSGDFLFVNVTAAIYTLEIEMPAFKSLRRPGIAVSPGSRVDVGSVTLEIGGRSEVVAVVAERALLQASSGERSYTVAPEEVEALPLADRNFATLAGLAPGVDASGRVGGGGGTNFIMDGVGTMDTGSNRQIVAVNVESIAEVKVLTSGYQAEYGRSSGLQITAVTKSGTNRIHGSVYDVERNSNWNANSKTNKLNGDPKLVSKQRDGGFSFGGPIGRPGARNKLFFFYAQEFQPRRQGNEVVRRRMPTALERAGDFSQTLDNNGNPYPYIRDALTGLPCSPSDTRGCFRAGGVLGRIPADRLYETGLNILRMFPLPNLPTEIGQRYNYEITRPQQSLLAYQPVLRVDYQPTARLRASAKYTGWRQHKEVVLGTIPGFNDTLMQNPVVGTWAFTANYTFRATTFLEATYGRSGNELAGCSLTGGGANFCTAALPINDNANRVNAGLGGLPFLFPDANVLDPNYYAYRVMNAVHPPIWDGTRIQMPPSFTWGGRVSNSTPAYSPDNIPFPGFLNVNHTQDVSVSVTKVAGRHAVKAGFFNTHSYKAQQRGGWNGTITFTNDSNNPLDAQFPFANAALGIFSSFNQASKYVEGVYVYNNTEGYVQDSWKVNRRLALDYGLRLVHQQPQYDSLGQASNFLVDHWQRSDAPLLYAAGCVNDANPCTGANRQAMNPLTRELLGPFSNLSIGAIVPGTGNPTNGLLLSGDGIAKTTYTWPFLAAAPRLGFAFDATGRQRIVVRGALGLFFDRPDGNSIYAQVQNPPTYKNITVRYGSLQTLGADGLTSEGPPALSVYEYKSKLPSSWQWNTGMQMMLPWYSSLDVAYVGHHSFNLLQSVNLNAVDFGAAFLPQNQDPTLAASATPGATAVSQDRMRPFRGYGAITQQWGRGWRSHHSLQVSVQRRFRHGISFGFNDTISLSDRQSTGVRLQHNADGSYFVRGDQAEADRLLGRAVTNRHIMKGNVVWELPRINGASAAARTLGQVVNGWRVSSIWTGVSGAPYTVGYSYQSGGGNVNITGSPDYAGRIRLVGNPGRGCADNRYEQFHPSAFRGPLYNSVGLESGNDYLRGCMVHTMDVSIARTVKLRGAESVQLRVDLFNAPNAATVTNRATTVNFASPNDPVTITNLPYDAGGNLIASRSLPRGAGIGVATDYQSPRRVQLQVRFSF